MVFAEVSKRKRHKRGKKKEETVESDRRVGTILVGQEGGRVVHVVPWPRVIGLLSFSACQEPSRTPYLYGEVTRHIKEISSLL